MGPAMAGGGGKTYENEETSVKCVLWLSIRPFVLPLLRERVLRLCGDDEIYRTTLSAYALAGKTDEAV